MINQNEFDNTCSENSLKSSDVMTEAELEAKELLDVTGDTLSCDDMSEEKSVAEEFFTEKEL